MYTRKPILLKYFSHEKKATIEMLGLKFEDTTGV